MSLDFRLKEDGATDDPALGLTSDSNSEGGVLDGDRYENDTSHHLYFRGAGSGDQVSVPDDQSLDFSTTDFTIAFRASVPKSLDINSNNNYRGVVGKGGAFDSYSVLFEENGTVTFSTYHDDGNSNRNFAGQIPMDGTEFTVVCTHDHSAGENTVYISGADTGTDTGTTADITVNSKDLKIGALGSNDLLAFMDEVRIDSRLWSHSEAQSYEDSSDPDRTAVELDLRLNEGGSTVATDDSGNNNDGTISGPVWVEKPQQFSVTPLTADLGGFVALDGEIQTATATTIGNDDHATASESPQPQTTAVTPITSDEFASAIDSGATRDIYARPEDGNRLDNQSFEENNVGEDPNAWEMGSSNDGVWDTTDTYSYGGGAKSCGSPWNESPGTWPDCYAYQDISVSGGEVINASAWVRFQSFSDGNWTGPQSNKQYVYEDDSRIHLYAYDSSDTQIAEWSNRWTGDAYNRGLDYVQKDGSWFYQEIAVTMPTDAVRLRFQIDGGDGNNDYIDPETGHGGNAGCWIDNVFVEQVGHTTGLADDTGAVQPALASVLLGNDTGIADDTGAVKPVVTTPLSALEKGLADDSGATQSAIVIPITSTEFASAIDTGATQPAVTTPLSALEKGLADDTGATQSAVTTPLSALERGLTDDTGATTDIISGVLSAQELGTTADTGSVADAIATTLSALESGLADDVGSIQDAAFTPLSGTESGIADDAGKIQPAVVDALSGAEVGITDDSGAITDSIVAPLDSTEYAAADDSGSTTKLVVTTLSDDDVVLVGVIRTKQDGSIKTTSAAALSTTS